MFNNTQFLLIASTIVEQFQRHKDPAKTPYSNLEFIGKLSKSATYAQVIVPDMQVTIPLVSEPIKLIGMISTALEKHSVTTWDGDNLDEESFNKVFDAVIGLNPDASSDDGSTVGNAILDSLPPMVRTMVNDGLEIMKSMDAQQSGSHSTSVMGNVSIIKPLNIDPETRSLNKMLIPGQI